MPFTLSRTVFISFICALVFSSCAHITLPDYYGEITPEVVFKGHPRTVTIKEFHLDAEDTTFFSVEHFEYDEDGNLILQTDEYRDEGNIVQYIYKQYFRDDGTLSHMEMFTSNPENPQVLDTICLLDYSILIKNKDMIVVRKIGTSFNSTYDIDEVDTLLFDYKTRTVVTNGGKVERYNKDGLLVERSYKNYSQDESADEYYPPEYFKYDRRQNLRKHVHYYEDTYTYLSFDKERNWTKRIYHGDFCIRNLEIAEYSYW